VGLADEHVDLWTKSDGQEKKTGRQHARSGVAYSEED
jgi:hypothetical protein